ncbi:hypothetical protein KHA94_00420 [Bacillus sp. FJAT-49705]|uniref:HNH endonuclease n=1 Tax=Cytobacillus citreus TaxID=2833586 RepID=A0ABS5NMI2_9BACI|nr:hypothetical protein [Cytobacillus citreus]MBS4188684.1 hypothetical protein [Cytobacillus citreus]
MDFSIASVQELYDIATDVTARMRDRYSATKELQERRKSVVGTKCKYPGCMSNTETTWALVGLCRTHHKLIKEETTKYYKQTGILYEYRIHYLKIVEHIPFARKE